MDFLKKINWKSVHVFKIILLVVGALFVLSIVLTLAGTSLKRIKGESGFNIMPSGGVMMYGTDSGVAFEESVKSYGVTSSARSPSLSVRNISPIMPPVMGGVAGNQAEAFEVTDYGGTIETSDLVETCGVIADLKAYTYVIFENENTYQKGCNFTFKVEHKRVSEIVAIIKGLDPKDFSENTYTIKRVVDDFTSEIEILQKKKASIDETLRKAIAAYDEVTALATRTQNVESLTKIIDSRIQIIERLTLENLNINQQLDYLNRSKSEQLDRLEYTYFHINVYENKYFDGQSIKDSWQVAIKDFIRTINQIFQGITINLLALMFFLVQWIVYALLVLVIGKHVWRLARYIWNK